MAEPILVAVAWPYANGPLHLGHIAGAYLPADIFARYQRIKGNRVLMVSGSDTHGTPITVRADQEGVSPEAIVERYHRSFLATWPRLGISFDLFTSTGTANHAAVTHDIFNTLRAKDLIYPATMEAMYCVPEQRFLPDRYIVGACPNCGYPRARGDQCENCGRPVDPKTLIEPRCVFDGSTPEVRETEHFFLRLTALQGPLLAWVEQVRSHWKPNVAHFVANFIRDGLLDRAITRDIEWGVRVPVEGYEHKRIYVWFEAVIGYLSASKEWAQRQGDPERWRDWWQQPGRSYYFIGKDNIFFHCIIWPGMLMGYGDHNLPYDVPANEFLNIEGQKLSTSQNWAVWVPDYLDRYDPDPLRYYLSINMPESGDADFSWREFLRKNNDELVATWGNLVNRVVSQVARHFAARIPEPGPLTAADQQALAQAQDTLERVGQLLNLCRFREGIRLALALAQEGNRYLEQHKPWETIQTDRARTATVWYVALTLVDALGIIFAPYLPFSSAKLQAMLGHGQSLEGQGWTWRTLRPGQPLGERQLLFQKLDESLVAAEQARLGQPPALDQKVRGA